MVLEKTHILPSINTPVTSSFFRVERFRFHTMGNGIQSIITSRSRFDTVIYKIKAWKSLQWFENINFGSHAVDMGKQKKISEKTLPQSHVMHKKPTARLALLKVTVLNIRRYKRRIEILTAVMVTPYEINPGIINYKHSYRMFISGPIKSVSYLPSIEESTLRLSILLRVFRHLLS